ncbi:hypothetical protein SKAU_G00105120 [Synaphobranchus kaupii]|uniref:PDZ domain-containing protein n=1 Tax=Synaphobranchus kaupii TaxID=118154 RepID=A0A9Q1G001_SYNKA|nr:hypothetical protein SKAU_G00105120 [Synaphobranchus kaupii]
MSKTLKKKKHWSGKVQECAVSWGNAGEFSSVVEVRGGAELGEFPYLGQVISDAMVCHVGRVPSSGDVLLEVNGTPVSGLTNRDTLAVIRHFREPIRLKTVKPDKATPRTDTTRTRRQLSLPHARQMLGSEGALPVEEGAPKRCTDVGLTQGVLQEGRDDLRLGQRVGRSGGIWDNEYFRSSGDGAVGRCDCNEIPGPRSGAAVPHGAQELVGPSQKYTGTDRSAPISAWPPPTPLEGRNVLALRPGRARRPGAITVHLFECSLQSLSALGFMESRGLIYASQEPGSAPFMCLRAVR